MSGRPREYMPQHSVTSKLIEIMTFIGRLCSPFCRTAKRGDEANLSESTVNESSPPSPWSLPARLLKKHNSILSHTAPMPRHIAESIPSPNSASNTTPNSRKRRWRLSNREALLDGNGGLVYVKKFVLQSPISPAQRTHDLPIYDAHMRSPTMLVEEYREVGDDAWKDTQVKQVENHINPGHEALDLLARMSTNEPGLRSHSLRGKERRASLCAPASKRERTVGFVRPVSLPLYAGFGSIHGNAEYHCNMVNATAHGAPRCISEHNETTSDTSSNYAHLELDSTQTPPTSPFSQPSQHHTFVEPKSPTTPSTTSHPSTSTSPLSSFGINSQPSPSAPSDTSHSSPSNSWPLPPVFERLYEDAERRQKQLQQEEYHSRR